MQKQDLRVKTIASAHIMFSTVGDIMNSSSRGSIKQSL